MSDHNVQSDTEFSNDDWGSVDSGAIVKTQDHSLYASAITMTDFYDDDDDDVEYEEEELIEDVIGEVIEEESDSESEDLVEEEYESEEEYIEEEIIVEEDEADLSDEQLLSSFESFKQLAKERAAASAVAATASSNNGSVLSDPVLEDFSYPLATVDDATGTVLEEEVEITPPASPQRRRKSNSISEMTSPKSYAEAQSVSVDGSSAVDFDLGDAMSDASSEESPEDYEEACRDLIMVVHEGENVDIDDMLSRCELRSFYTHLKQRHKHMLREQQQQQQPQQQQKVKQKNKQKTQNMNKSDDWEPFGGDDDDEGRGGSNDPVFAGGPFGSPVKAAVAITTVEKVTTFPKSDADNNGDDDDDWQDDPWGFNDPPKPATINDLEGEEEDEEESSQPKTRETSDPFETEVGVDLPTTTDAPTTEAMEEEQGGRDETNINKEQQEERKITVWEERNADDPDDYEDACYTLYNFIYKDDEECDLATSLQRTSPKDLYYHLKHQYWYMVHTGAFEENALQDYVKELENAEEQQIDQQQRTPRQKQRLLSPNGLQSSFSSLDNLSNHFAKRASGDMSLSSSFGTDFSLKRPKIILKDTSSEEEEEEKEMGAEICDDANHVEAESDNADDADNDHVPEHVPSHSMQVQEQEDEEIYDDENHVEEESDIVYDNDDDQVLEHVPSLPVQEQEDEEIYDDENHVKEESDVVNDNDDGHVLEHVPSMPVQEQEDEEIYDDENHVEEESDVVNDDDDDHVPVQQKNNDSSSTVQMQAHEDENGEKANVGDVNDVLEIDEDDDIIQEKTEPVASFLPEPEEMAAGINENEVEDDDSEQIEEEQEVEVELLEVNEQETSEIADDDRDSEQTSNSSVSPAAPVQEQDTESGGGIYKNDVEDEPGHIDEQGHVQEQESGVSRRMEEDSLFAAPSDELDRQDIIVDDEENHNDIHIEGSGIVSPEPAKDQVTPLLPPRDEGDIESMDEDKYDKSASQREGTSMSTDINLGDLGSNDDDRAYAFLATPASKSDNLDGDSSKSSSDFDDDDNWPSQNKHFNDDCSDGGDQNIVDQSRVALLTATSGDDFGQFNGNDDVNNIIEDKSVPWDDCASELDSRDQTKNTRLNTGNDVANNNKRPGESSVLDDDEALCKRRKPSYDDAEMTSEHIHEASNMKKEDEDAAISKSIVSDDMSPAEGFGYQEVIESDTSFNSPDSVNENSGEKEPQDAKAPESELSDMEKTNKLINDELEMLLAKAEAELEDPMEPEGVEALKRAARKVSYNMKYYDVLEDKFVYLPSVTKTIMDYSLTDEAETLYFDEEDEFPIEYTSALRHVAGLHFQQDNLDYEYIEKLAVCIDTDEQETDEDTKKVSSEAGEQPHMSDRNDEERKQVQRIIKEELDRLIAEAEEHELDEPFEPEAISALVIASMRLGYTKKYFDEEQNEFVYFPTLSKCLMNYALTEEAEKHYSHDGMEEFPIEYIAALREVALKHVQNDDLDYENIEMLAQNVYADRDQLIVSVGELTENLVDATEESLVAGTGETDVANDECEGSHSGSFGSNADGSPRSMGKQSQDTQDLRPARSAEDEAEESRLKEMAEILEFKRRVDKQKLTEDAKLLGDMRRKAEEKISEEMRRIEEERRSAELKLAEEASLLQSKYEDDKAALDDEFHELEVSWTLGRERLEKEADALETQRQEEEDRIENEVRKMEEKRLADSALSSQQYQSLRGRLVTSRSNLEAEKKRFADEERAEIEAESSEEPKSGGFFGSFRRNKAVDLEKEKEKQTRLMQQKMKEMELEKEIQDLEIEQEVLRDAISRIELERAEQQSKLDMEARLLEQSMFAAEEKLAKETKEFNDFHIESKSRLLAKRRLMEETHSDDEAWINGEKVALLEKMKKAREDLAIEAKKQRDLQVQQEEKINQTALTLKEKWLKEEAILARDIEVFESNQKIRLVDGVESAVERLTIVSSTSVDSMGAQQQLQEEEEKLIAANEETTGDDVPAEIKAEMGDTADAEAKEQQISEPSSIKEVDGKILVANNIEEPPPIATDSKEEQVEIVDALVATKETPTMSAEKEQHKTMSPEDASALVEQTTESDDKKHAEEPLAPAEFSEAESTDTPLFEEPPALLPSAAKGEHVEAPAELSIEEQSMALPPQKGPPDDQPANPSDEADEVLPVETISVEGSTPTVTEANPETEAPVEHEAPESALEEETTASSLVGEGEGKVTSEERRIEKSSINESTPSETEGAEEAGSPSQVESADVQRTEESTATEEVKSADDSSVAKMSHEGLAEETTEPVTLDDEPRNTEATASELTKEIAAAADCEPTELGDEDEPRPAADVVAPTAGTKPQMEPMVTTLLKTEEQILEGQTNSLSNLGFVQNSDGGELNDESSKSLPENLFSANQPQHNENAADNLAEGPLSPEEPMSAVSKEEEERTGFQSKSISSSDSGQNSDGVLERAIEFGDWEAVGEAAAKMNDYASAASVDTDDIELMAEGMSPVGSTRSGSSETDNLDDLIDRGDWTAVVQAVSPNRKAKDNAVSKEQHAEEIRDGVQLERKEPQEESRYLKLAHPPDFENDEDGGSLSEADFLDPPPPPPEQKPMLAAALKANEQMSKSVANLGSGHDVEALYEEFSRSVPEHLMSVHQPTDKDDDEVDAGSLSEADVFDPPAPPPEKRPMVAAALKAKEQIAERLSKSVANLGSGHDMEALYEEFSRSVPEHLMSVHQPTDKDDDVDAGSLSEADVFDPPAPPPEKRPMVAAALKAKEQIAERLSKSVANLGSGHDMEALYEEFSRSVPEHLMSVHQPTDKDDDVDAGSLSEADVFDPPAPPAPKKPMLAAALKAKDQIMERQSKSVSNLDSGYVMEDFYEELSKSVPEHLMAVHQPLDKVDIDAGSLDEADVFDPPAPPAPKKPMLVAALKAKEQIMDRLSKSVSNLDGDHDTEKLYEELSKSVPEHLMAVHQPNNEGEDAGSLEHADVFDPPAPPPPKKPLLVAALKAKEQITERLSKSIADLDSGGDSRDMKELYDEFSRSVPEHLMLAHQPRDNHDGDGGGSLGAKDVFDAPSPPTPRKPMVVAALKAKEQIIERQSKSAADFQSVQGGDRKAVDEASNDPAPVMATNQTHKEDSDDSSQREAVVSESPASLSDEPVAVASDEALEHAMVERGSQSLTDLNLSNTLSMQEDMAKSDSRLASVCGSPSRRRKKGVGVGNRLLLEAKQMKESGWLPALCSTSGSFSQADSPEKVEPNLPRTGGSAFMAVGDDTSPEIHALFAQESEIEPTVTVSINADEEESSDSDTEQEHIPDDPVAQISVNTEPDPECSTPVAQEAKPDSEIPMEQDSIANIIDTQRTPAADTIPMGGGQDEQKAKEMETRESSDASEPSLSPSSSLQKQEDEEATNLARNMMKADQGVSMTPKIPPSPETLRRLDTAAQQQPHDEGIPQTQIDGGNEKEECASPQTHFEIVESVKSVKEARMSLERRVQNQSKDKNALPKPNSTSISRASQWAKEASQVGVDGDGQSNGQVEKGKNDSADADRLLWWRKNGKRLVDEKRGLNKSSIAANHDTRRAPDNSATKEVQSTSRSQVPEEESASTSLWEKRRRASEARQRALQVRNGDDMMRAVSDDREPMSPTTKKKMLAEKRRQVIEARKGTESATIQPSESSDASQNEAPESPVPPDEELLVTDGANAVASSARTGRMHLESSTSFGRVALLAGRMDSAALEERRKKRLEESERLAERTARARQSRLARESRLSITTTQQVPPIIDESSNHSVQGNQPVSSPTSSLRTSLTTPSPQQSSSLIPHMVREADRLAGFICRYEQKLETLSKSLLTVAQQYENDSEATGAASLPLQEMYSFVRDREWYKKHAVGASSPSILFNSLKAEADLAQTKKHLALTTPPSSNEPTAGQSLVVGGDEKVYKVTSVGESFLKMDGPVEADVCRFLSSVHNRGEGLPKTSIKKNWTDIARLSGDVQSERVRDKLDALIQFCLDARFIE